MLKRYPIIFSAMILSLAGNCFAQTVGEQIDEAHRTLQSQQADQASALKELREATEANKKANEKTNDRITTLHEPTDPIDPVDPVDPTDPPPGQLSDIGTNPAYPSYWTRGWVFRDAAKQADLWRDNGNAYVYWQTGHPPPGTYTALWTGSGSIRFNFVNIINRASNSVTFTFNPIGLQMQKTGEILSLSILPNEGSPGTFHPEYLKRSKIFGVFRFMDWGKTNTTRIVKWSDRVTPAAQTAATGVPIEHMIELVNTLNADPWFCMPHTANDNYIRRFAQMAKARVHPNAKIYVEWSNEVWNSQFGVYHFIKNATGEDLGNPKFYAMWAERSTNAFRIWCDVFAGEEHRLVRVAATQLQNPDVGRKIATALNGEFDAIAPSGYVGINNNSVPFGATADTLIDMMFASIERDNKGWYKDHADLAASWSQALDRKIRLITYEAGQHLSPNGNDKVHWYDAYVDAQTNDRMYDVYSTNMIVFEAAGGDLFTAFNDVGKISKFGAWGHLQYQVQPISDAPKYRALVESP